MRIGLNALFVIPGKVGGTEIYVRNLVRALGATTHEYSLYVGREAAGTFDPLPANVREVACSLDSESRPARIAYEQTRLALRARRDRLDLLHSLGYTAPLVLGCPSVVTLHDLNYHFHPEDWARAALYANRLLVPRCARRATRVLTISQSSRAAIRDVLGIPDTRIDVVYHGVDGNLARVHDDVRRAVRAKNQLDGDYLLSVTASHPHKNLDGLLAAYELACATWDRPPPLVVVGIRGRDHARVEGHRGRGRVVVTGWVDDTELSALYREARLFVFASKYEGFGFPVLEAMSVGVPVASSNATSLPELVGDAAIMFDPTRREAIAEAMVRGCADQGLRERLITAGRARAAGFLWNRCAAETVAVYQRAVRDRTGPA
ncbi:MAG: glycosyltransferase family 4 protein [Kofleriaceae bacterium]